MTIKEGLEAVLLDYEVNEKRSIYDARQKIASLLRGLDGDLALEQVTVPMLLQYAKGRRGAGRSPATINREIAFLRRAYTLSGEPWAARGWQRLRESAPRSGFFERVELDKILARIPHPERAVVQFLHLTGWRRGEALSLRWSQVDLERHEIRLEAGTTKSGEPRIFPIYPQLAALVAVQYELKSGDWVFHRSGRPIKKSRLHNIWTTACREAGFPGRLIHDFRRTAARNLLSAGVDRQVAMRLLGHKTESIFNRYRIVTGTELQTAVEKLSKLIA